MSDLRSARSIAGICLSLTLLGLAARADPLPGMPPVIDPSNLYSEAEANKLSPAVEGALTRAYVPNLRSNDVYVIRPP